MAEYPVIEGFSIHDEGRIRHIVLDRPGSKNALNRSMRQAFSGILSEADSSDQVGAVVLSGAGGVFSAGVDLKDRPKGALPIEPNPAAALRSYTKPLIAAVDGPCVTGALEMVLSCDFAIGSPQARFADTHCKVGLFPRWGGGSLLCSAIGVRRARQMMLSGTFIDADTALRWGILNEIVPSATLLDRTSELAEAMVRQMTEQPLAFGLHNSMLNEIAKQERFSGIETAYLEDFDNAHMVDQRILRECRT